MAATRLLRPAVWSLSLLLHGGAAAIMLFAPAPETPDDVSPLEIVSPASEAAEPTASPPELDAAQTVAPETALAAAEPVPVQATEAPVAPAVEPPPPLQAEPPPTEIAQSPPEEAASVPPDAIPLAELEAPPPPPPPAVAAPPPRPAPTRPVTRPVQPPARPAAPAAAQPGPVASQPSGPPPTWLGQVSAALARQRQYPAQLRSRGVTGIAMLRFAIRRDGSLLGARIERSSGHAELDELVMAMVRRAAPLPQPPADYGGEVIELVVPIRFELR